MGPVEITRRTCLTQMAAAGLAPLLTGWSARAAEPAARVPLVAGALAQPLVADAKGPSALMAFSGSVPGPTLSFAQGETVGIDVTNALGEDTSVHWHGIRVPNAMDGVAGLTQPPIEPGASFAYTFAVPDAGTYWYHAHMRAYEQVSRGLYGPLIVREAEPPPVDRDIVWMLSDWRIGDDGVLTDDYLALHDLTHAGRIGNLVTINGIEPGPERVAEGERIRLRLINAATARIFMPSFPGLDAWLVALDGHPLAEAAPMRGAPIRLGPAQRADLILEIGPETPARIEVVDAHYPRATYTLAVIEKAGRAPDGKADLAWDRRLPPNPLAVPDLANAERHEITMGGGAMSPQATFDFEGRSLGLRELALEHQMAWAINGKVYGHHAAHETPLLALSLGRTHVIRLRNDSRWPHPMHLHGMPMQVIARNGEAVALPYWRDTVLLDGNADVEVAVVADNPGKWMFHCHVLLHQYAGMMATIDVA